MRRSVLVALALSAAPATAFAQAYYIPSGAPGAPRQARAVEHTGSVASPQPGSLGGGFIELLMTGRDPTPYHGQPAGRRVMPAHAPAHPTMPAHAPADPMTGEPVLPARRHMAAVQPRGQFDRPIERALDPRFARQEVDYAGRHAAGTIVIDTEEKFLYLVQGNGRALRYGIGVGRPGFEWAGVKSVTRKQEWPDWRPPAAMLKRRPDLPRFMKGGGDNPMGARALYLGSSLYRIHGTNEPHTIGQAVSSGCIRMTNDDVIDLYERVRVGARVVVM